MVKRLQVRGTSTTVLLRGTKSSESLGDKAAGCTRNRSPVGRVLRPGARRCGREAIEAVRSWLVMPAAELTAMLTAATLSPDGLVRIQVRRH